MLKIKKVNNTDTKPDTELWLEKLGDSIIIRAKLDNNPAIVTIARIDKDGMFIRSDIPGKISRLLSFKTKKTVENADFYSICHKTQYIHTHGS